MQRYMRRFALGLSLSKLGFVLPSSGAVSNRRRNLHSISMDVDSLMPVVNPRARYSHDTALHKQYKTFTDGSLYWKDNYLLERWKYCEQPVVYLGHTYHGYELRLRLGDWCWLTKDPLSGRDMTIKFLNQWNKHELPLARFISEHSRSQHICAMTDSFEIQHHLANIDDRCAGIKFSTIVYPTMGTDLRRISTCCGHIEGPNVPLSSKRRKQCIHDIVRGLADLHRIGVVHGDIHPGNCALPPPSNDEIEKHLASHKPLIHKVIRMDGNMTDPYLPIRVTEPIDLGFGEGHTRIFDFDYSFRAIDGASYSQKIFPSGTPLPPELLDEGSTAKLPFKIDSWHLGLCIYFILTQGRSLVEGTYGPSKYGFSSYEKQTALLQTDDQDNDVNEAIRADLLDGFRPILLSLTHHDPEQRASVQEILENPWLFDDE